MDAEIYRLSERVGLALKARKLMMSTAESCTGGWIGQAITMVPGSSSWFDRGFITYTNEAKQDMLGVRAETLNEFGAVSEQTVREMVAGALGRSRAQVAVAVSGIAGPEGGSVKKPVGTVLLAWGQKGTGTRAQPMHFPGDRDTVRRLSVIAALEGILALLQPKS
jgi:nicotinamide-nucleotide amidase